MKESMSEKTITIQVCQCHACGHTWLPRKVERTKKCPRCQCLSWDNKVEAERLRINREALNVRLSA